ncbi:DUF1553 domain-containing protein [Roseiconus nitratireducens]|uniref:DUF1553 domain-containing protein n=2 Tax=Roseiconus nitratireducens TaxID=2605748 RepID=A0A5M6CXH8_9BACT|nr:DUF1553 domain-containing protein [Roseiconus nitratireducens]
MLCLLVGLFTFPADHCVAADVGSAPTETHDPSAQISADHLEFFEAKVRPLLVEHCYDCHSEEAGESSGDLMVDSADGLRRGGSMGPAVVAGKPAESLLIRAIRYEHSDLEMPPTGKLDDAAIATLERWIELGAPDPRRAQGAPTESVSPMDIDPKSHWAFNVPRNTSRKIQPGADDRDVIDSIARQVADQAGVQVSRRCDDATLVRRLYHDLTGLPPTVDQIARFCESDRPDKVERLADELLASPAFAERFARHWMDVARYADTIGYATAGKERRLTGSERYRDWLIRAFATDLPYDEMIRLQLAADRLDPENERGHLDAMGFLTIGRRFLNRYDTIDDRIDVITRGLMGMTVTCARCHDHKFDPIPTTDYYSLLGVLESSTIPEEGASPLMMVDKDNPHDSKVFLRGQPHNRGEVAPRQYLTALRQPDEPRFTDGSGRLELAEKVASPDNPLTSRVFVNRIWSHLIGRPFVDSTSDFGVRTETPALVEVLDELAADFSTDWSIQRLIRRIVTSRIYAQSDQAATPACRTADPENRLAARGNRKRRDFESMRDSMLAVCGMLDRRVGGDPVEIHLNTPNPRRTLYAMIDRQNLPSLFRTFDVASPDAHTPKRYFTTVPQQALFLMNHPQTGVLVSELADQVRAETPDPEAQIRQMFRRVVGRLPDPNEIETCRTFLQQDALQPPDEFDPRSAWRYGTTTVNEESAVTDFQPLKTFSGSQWQDTDEFPSKGELSYASLGLENGHPGGQHAVVRRWIAPADGRVTISGMVGHRNKQGDGVELAIWIGGERVWRENQKSNNRPFSRIRGKVAAGQTVDFVVSPRQTPSFDSFFLRCQVSLRSNDGEYFEGDSKRDFAGPLNEASQEPLDRLAQLAQVLILSNEFLFVD